MATKTELGAHHALNESHVELIEYPTEDGEPMPGGEIQSVPMNDMIGFLQTQFRDCPDVYVWGNMFIYYREGYPSAVVAPNVFVVFGARGEHLRKSWFTWREGTTPDFVLEVATENTWGNDATSKRDTYAEIGVSEYWRFDPTGEFFATESPNRQRLIGERLVDGLYEPIPLAYDPDEVTLRGRSEVLGLDICALPGMKGDPIGTHIRCYDPVRSEWLRTHEQEAEARQQAEAEVQRLTAELERLRSV